MCSAGRFCVCELLLSLIAHIYKKGVLPYVRVCGVFIFFLVRAKWISCYPWIFICTQLCWALFCFTRSLSFVFFLHWNCGFTLGHGLWPPWSWNCTRGWLHAGFELVFWLLSWKFSTLKEFVCDRSLWLVWSDLPFSFGIWKTFCYPKYAARSSVILVPIIFLKLIPLSWSIFLIVLLDGYRKRLGERTEIHIAFIQRPLVFISILPLTYSHSCFLIECQDFHLLFFASRFIKFGGCFFYFENQPPTHPLIAPWDWFVQPLLYL